MKIERPFAHSDENADEKVFNELIKREEEEAEKAQLEMEDDDEGVESPTKH